MMARSYAAWFYTAGSENPATNALRFATESEADRYAMDLLLRWAGARDYEIRPSDDPVNYAIVNDEIVRLPEVTS